MKCVELKVCGKAYSERVRERLGLLELQEVWITLQLL